MKRIIFALSVLILIFTSCSTSDEALVNEPSLPSGFLKQVIESGTGGATSTFTYSGAKLANVVSGTEKTVYTYTGDLITEIKVYEGSVLMETIIYQYATNGNLAMSKNTNSSGNYVKNTFTYNTDGTISYVKVSGNATTTQITPYFTGKVYFTNGDVTKVYIDYGPGNQSFNTTETYTYDTNISPFKNVIGFEKINLAEELTNNFDFGINHNILTYKHNVTLLTSNVFAYNTSNYPTQLTQTSMGNVSTKQMSYY
ncbi:hypothetical protein G6N05_09930 [Flavobacterium sp. F372]|uniref:DUF4595 domain-containing protein n=1 Tax=Flavobacterium bernardetii TaxID=2813823 RepID=A0ABR7IYM3_9FLAO|nr:hypothetical protein [Flavobacterium bernardetii]MBC5834777.1 hypothetical protein [Flavobacterium bernardetii]NHF70425.1 hypothetical protein [Flavobacterium bernardetii]